MSTSISTVSEYISQLEESRKKIIENLRKAMKSNLPAGFNEEINYGMIG